MTNGTIALTPNKLRESIDAIVTESNRAITAAQELEADLQKQHNALLLKIQRQGQFTPAERKEIERLGADLQAVRMTIALLGLETMQRIDSSSDVASVKQAIQSVNKALKAQVTRMKKIAATAAKIEKVTTRILKVGAKLVELAAKVA